MPIGGGSHGPETNMGDRRCSMPDDSIWCVWTHKYDVKHCSQCKRAYGAPEEPIQLGYEPGEERHV